MAQHTRRNFGRLAIGLGGALWAQRAEAQQNTCAPPSGTPQNFSAPRLQNIQRKAVATLTQNEIDRLRLAYSKLRALTVSDPNDPRGWMQQANVHCWQCGGSGMDIHQSWSFLPWHRAYLYFHERILCKLLNDNSFRLPYWSWDYTNTRNLPVIYRSPKIGSVANSLYDANRSPGALAGQPMPASIFPRLRNPLNAANFGSFGGSADEGGSLENGPHGAIHMWSGPSSSPYADMGNLSTAARDPLFYAHHCNIDRLWSEWVRRNPVGHANPTNAEFLTQTFPFFDENSNLRTIAVQDVLDTAALGFSYAPGAGLSKPSVPRWTKLPYDATTQLIKLPAPITNGVIATTRSLVLKQVQIPDESGLYNIFAGDVPAAGADQSTAPNYLGYLGLIVGHHPSGRGTSLVLDANSDFLQRAAGSGAQLTIAPAGSANGTKLQYSAAYLTEE